MQLLSYAVFALAVFTSNAMASDDKRFMRKGLETLYLQELKAYEACRENEFEECSFSEVYGFLRLLELNLPEEKIAPRYPTAAQRAGYAAVVTTELTISDAWLVEDVKLLSCESGFGDADLKLNWRHDGRYCGKFESAAKDALTSFKFPIFPLELQCVPRKQLWRNTFLLQGRNSNDINAQITDLKSSQIKKIQKLSKAKDWSALENYALQNSEENNAFLYYAADSALMLGDGPLAISRFTQFLKNGGHSYWHFGVKAAAITVSHYYELGNDQEVVDLAGHSLLAKYLEEGNVITKAAIADALLKYASSLTLIEKPEIAKALGILEKIKRHGQLYGGIPKGLMDIVNQQIVNIESQIIAIGKSKVRQEEQE